ncbi:MAG: type 1 glutamine amidotransferase [Maritimibacter sp.]|nr:type 1 glutamine amidotransferase [Maritimibacter sp.]
MRIGILMTNTDESAFAEAHPRDGEKWRAALAPLCPECDFPVYSVKDGQFPEHVAGHDGFLITGSPASVNDLAPWLDRLFALIREAVAAGVPLFGACFGHQAIALALGGAVEENPGGWVFGATETQVHSPAPWMEAGPLSQYAAHVEQVTRLPEGAEVVMGNAECPIGGFVIGEGVFTTQYHPEMTHGFVSALIAEYAAKLPPEVAAQAQASLAEPADNDRVARWIMAFFRRARG